MITKESSGNYEQLLHDAGVTSLRDLFDKLGTLIQQADGYKFLKLPINEPYFEINANTREIIVPNDFKKNGIAVSGDNYAEILFFSIDRFYDAADLSKMSIDILWHHSNNPMQVYEIAAFYPSLESINETDEKVIFGWPVSQQATQEAGKLIFAIRFSNNDNTFVLSTLPQTVLINKGLMYDEDTITQEDTKFEDILNTRFI